MSICLPVCGTRAPWCFLKELQPTLELVGTAHGKDLAGAGAKLEEEGAAERNC